MSPDRELAQLDAMLDATLDALLQRANAPASSGASDGGAEDDDDGMVSFAVGQPGASSASAPPLDPELEELWQMVDRARNPEALDDDEDGMVSFGVGGDGQEGKLARIQRESTELVNGLLTALTTPYVIETGEGPSQIQTRMGWLGDTRTHATPGLPAELLAAHVAATEAKITTSANRMRMLAMVMSAAGKISAAIATPGGAVMALPIAYKCVREVHQRWSSLSATSVTEGVS